MHSCGMYDSAGEFTFTVRVVMLIISCLASPPSFLFQVGLPAKSGVSGVIIVVVPNVMGLCLYSPLVNKNGNSLRGLNFCQVSVGSVVVCGMSVRWCCGVWYEC